MTTSIDPQQIPMYEDRDGRDEAYHDAEAAGTPFFAIETYERGYAVTYDLLPAGRELSVAAREDVDEASLDVVEDIVGDATEPTTEVSRSIGASLGHLAFFENEAAARRVGATVAEIVLDETNWVGASGGAGGSGASDAPDADGRDLRRN